jgi:[acyl-carrier-protein] S-malonyltransferase
MEDAQAGLAEFLEEIEIRDARIPVVANVTARPVTAAAEIRANLIAQMTAPVRWEESMRWFLAAGPVEFTEIGAGSVLKGLLRSIDRAAVCTALGSAESVAEALGADEVRG